MKLSHYLLTNLALANIVCAQFGTNSQFYGGGRTGGSSGGTPVEAAEWTLSLRQEQLATGGVFQNAVGSEGRALSTAPVSDGGSEFQLWALRRQGSLLEETLVDSEFVGSYRPTGDISIQTKDPYDGPIPRTRIDQGFTVTVDVAGLVTNAASQNVPLAARQVLLNHTTENYYFFFQGRNRNSFTSSRFNFSFLTPERDFDQRMLTENGRQTLTFSASNIVGNDVYSDSGVETFRLFTLPDGDVGELLLDEAKVQIWPLSKAQITGINEQEQYRDFPEIRVALLHLYPSSTTYLQVYPGPAAPGTVGTKVTESSIIVDDEKPRTTQLVFRELQRYFPDDGIWTIEVLTETPFGTEILDTKVITFAKNLTIRGSLQTLGD